MNKIAEKSRAWLKSELIAKWGLIDYVENDMRIIVVEVMGDFGEKGEKLVWKQQWGENVMQTTSSLYFYLEGRDSFNY